MRPRALRPLRPAVEALADAIAPATVLADVQRVWEGAVGPAIAREASPLSEREGTLTVLCSSAVWMQEIDLMGPILVDKVNAALGGERVARLRCVATRGRHPSPDD